MCVVGVVTFGQLQGAATQAMQSIVEERQRSRWPDVAAIHDVQISDTARP